MIWSLGTESEGAGCTGVCWLKWLIVEASVVWPRDFIQRTKDRPWEQVQNQPEVSGALARSSVGVCGPPLGACVSGCLEESEFKQTPRVISIR